MSIWGKRVDGWFDRKTGAADVDRGDYDRGGLRALAILAGLALVVVLLVLLDAADDAF